MENVNSKIINEVKKAYNDANEIFKDVRSVKEFHDIVKNRNDIGIGAYDGYNNEYNLIDFDYKNCIFTIEIFKDKEPYILTNYIDYWDEERQVYIVVLI